MKWGRRQEEPHSGGIPEAADGGRSPQASIFTPPEPFADRYTSLHLLGRGGFGDVYRAWDTQMERAVALKLLKRELALDADWRRRFRQEATRNLLHPNITINFDIGAYQDQPFIVMELVEGDTLSKIIERRIPLTDVERLSLIEQLCDGLHYAHTQQVIHRDIKPANLMVCEKQQGDRIVRVLKILDFGIARVVSTEETSTGSFMFSPPYVSPEQVRGEHTDERSDMFAVGAVAYELLSYQKAFDIRSKNLFEILNEVRRKNAEAPHRPLLEIRPEIDPQLSAVIDRALAKQPADRFRTLAEMGRELRRVRERFEDESGEDSSPTVVLSATVQTTVREARQALEAGDPTAALGKLEHALASRLSRAERRLLDEILADARERHYQKSGARHQHDRAAVAEAVEWARTAFANGQRTAAIDRLSRVEPVELVIDELETLRATKAALAHAEHTVNAGTPSEGREAIERLERSCPPELISADVVRLRQLADARPAGDDEVWKAVATARADFVRGRRREALATLEQVEPLPFVTAALEQMRDASAAIERAAAEVRTGSHDARTEALRSLEEYDPPELVVGALEELRTAAATRDTPYGVIRQHTGGSRDLGSSYARRLLARTGILIVATGMIAFGAYRWWPSPEPPGDKTRSDKPINSSAAVRQQISDLWSQDRRVDAVSELEKAIDRWRQDTELIQIRERFAGEAKAASEQARRRAEDAGAAADQFFGVAAAAAKRAQTHETDGRPGDSIRAYLDAASNYYRAMENTAPVAAVDAYLKAGDRPAALDALSRGLKSAPDNLLLRQRLDGMRADALKSVETAHQSLTRQKSFDQNASDYRTARQDYDAARSRAEPASIRVLWDLPARFAAAGEKMSEAAGLQTRGLEQARAGQQKEALTILRDARARYPGYRATRQLGRGLRESATELTQGTRKAAAGAGASAQTSVAFAEGLQAEQQASRATSDEAAIESLQEATRLFDVAAKEGPRTAPASAPNTGAPNSSSHGRGNDDTPTSAGSGKPANTTPPPVVKAPEPNSGRRDRAAEETDITATIEQYRRGYREMNPGIVLSVYPTFSKERQKQLHDAAGTCKAYPVEFPDGMKIDFTERADGATVTARRARYGCDRKRGGGIDFFEPQTEFFTLQKEDGRWIIKDMPGR